MWPDSPRFQSLRALAARLHAPGAALDEPCTPGVARASSRCRRPALASFFHALDAIETRGERAGVVLFGNSIVASDGVTDVVRERLTRRFGDAGRGLVLADRMASYGPRGRTARRATGWATANIADAEALPAPIGVTGVVHVSDGPARSVFELDGEAQADVFWVAPPGMPPLRWRADDDAWHELSGRAGPRMARVTLPRGATRFELATSGVGTVVEGVALERPSRGVVFDVCGVPSADATLWLRADEALFAQQLRARAPRLAVVMLGGNETKRLEWGRATRESTEAGLDALLTRVRDAVPQASCLVVGPLDAVKGPRDDEAEPLRARPLLPTVNALERRVAFAHGCAFFDLYAAMGGAGSVRRFDEAGLMHEDLTHPRGRGLDVLGLLLSDALMAAYAEGDWLVDAPLDPRLARSR